jgi:DNA modification methylase
MPIWVKNNFGIWYYTRPQYEPMLLYLNWKPPVLERPISDVIYEDKIQIPVHSCEKPVNLYRYLLNNFSKEWDTIFEWFWGVCWIAIACKELRRNYIVCELEQKYVDIANKRLNHTTTSLF